jgi:nucleotide-binding universal stress UspA family protein
MSYKKILVGTDGSPPSLESVRHAASLAKASGGELVVLCAYQPVDQATIERWRLDAPEEISWRLGAATAAEEAVERARIVAEEMGVAARLRIEHGEPADMLVTVAELEDADLVVMGNRGMTGAARFLIGSVPNNVSHHAPCDVLIVKTMP